VEWQKDIDDKTDFDESIASTKDGEVTAPIAGTVVQEMSLQKGDYMPACTIAAISVKPGIKGLTPGEGQTGVGPDQDGFFMMWGVELGDEVPEGFGLAVIKGDDGSEFNVSAQSPGLVVRMAKLKTGDRVNVPTFIATLVSPLGMPDPPVLAGRSSQSGYFVKYRKDVGEQAVAMAPVGDLMSAEDAAYTSDAPTSGELVARLPLEKGDYVKDGTILVTVRKPTIFPGPGQVPVTHGVAGGFVRWDVDGGKIYYSNDSALSFTPYGPIPDESRFLGRSLEEDMMHLYLPTTGILVQMAEFVVGEEMWVGETVGVLTPPLFVSTSDVYVQKVGVTGRFISWSIEEGDQIHEGDEIGTIMTSDGQNVSATFTGNGTVRATLSLQYLDMIDENIEVVALYSPYPPWWLPLLCCLTACCCCIVSLFCCNVYKKKKEEEEPLIAPEPEPVVEEAPEPEPVVEAEPPPVVVVPAAPPKPDGLRVDFRTPQGDIVSKYFKYHPLGIMFHKNETPIKVLDFHFNSYGLTEGVEQDWTVVLIDDTSVEENKNYHDVDKKLLDHLSKNPWWPLDIEFRTDKGELKTISFKKQPLGMVFSKHAPIKIDSFKSDSYGHSMGVELGWTMTKLAGEDVGDLSFKEVDNKLKDGLSRLEPIPGHKYFKSSATGSHRTRSQDNSSNHSHH